MNDCLFCKIVKGEIPCYKLFENETVISFLDVHPNGEGHTLIIPKKHYKDIEDIELETLKEINKMTKEVYKLLTEKLKPIGIRIVQNNGICQEIKHYHMHIIPVYKKDYKEDIKKTYELLKS